MKRINPMTYISNLSSGLLSGSSSGNAHAGSEPHDKKGEDNPNRDATQSTGEDDCANLDIKDNDMHLSQEGQRGYPCIPKGSEAILIVDDDPLDQRAIERALEQYDMEVVCVDNGNAAISMLNSRKFDCVFLDYFLPDMTGVDVLQQIFDEKSNQLPCPTILLTGQNNMNVMLDALQFGAQDYLIKDHITPETIEITLAKAKQIYDLIDERKKTEEQLLRSQKMEAVGQLTGGIAHDFNNLLTIIFGNTRLIETLLINGELTNESLVRHVQAIKKSAGRGANLVKRLMMFSRSRALDPSTIDLNNLIIDVEDLLRRSLGENIDMDFQLSPDIWSVFIDPGQLEHAIINICVNARDAMAGGGSLVISTHNFTANHAFVLRNPGLTEGEYVVLEIEDNGCGMDRETRKKIFDPFFTTKSVGKGTGLGLSVVYSLIKQSGGEIFVSSTPNKGTTFQILLPKSIAEIEQEMEIRPDIPIDTRGTETILVVEDEDEIRYLTALMLKQDGYHVLEAEDGDHALALMEDEGLHIDLLFTDIVMPGDTNGVQLASIIHKKFPEVHVVFTTGYTQESVSEYKQDGLIEKYHILNKPYGPGQMKSMLRQILDQEETVDEAIGT